MTTNQREVALKWLAGEMSNTQAAAALKIRASRNVYQKMAVLIRELYRSGFLKIKRGVPVRGTID
jgi:hypothetical protein